ncbi:hypothetical protein HMPREF1582_01336 [Gardnerella vaginalis JCP8151A]|nr:hypothetical protein HMPREF1582_01336 [Gardnerella vaginalis JCP8151A]
MFLRWRVLVQSALIFPEFVRDLGQIWYKVRQFFRFLYVILVKCGTKCGVISLNSLSLEEL